MCDRNETLTRCRKLLDMPNKANRAKEPPKCRCCLYYQPDFRYRSCLFSECPYGKARNTEKQKKPQRQSRHGFFRKKEREGIGKYKAAECGR